MGLFGVRPEKEAALVALFDKLGIREKDIEEKFVRSSGKGGQKVNKTSTCVYLKHGPSGLEVKVSRERSQNLNRFLARRLLAEKYQREILGQETQRDAKTARIRKQKKRRERRQKTGEN